MKKKDQTIINVEYNAALFADVIRQSFSNKIQLITSFMNKGIGKASYWNVQHPKLFYHRTQRC